MRLLIIIGLSILLSACQTRKESSLTLANGTTVVSQHSAFVNDPLTLISDKDAFSDAVARVRKVATFYPESRLAIISPTNSMYPLLDWDTLCVTRRIDFEAIQIGDIIAYPTGPNGTVLHRVVSKTNQRLTLRGDNLLFPDQTRPYKTDTFYKLVYLTYFNRIEDDKPTKSNTTYLQNPVKLVRTSVETYFELPTSVLHEKSN